MRGPARAAWLAIFVVAAIALIRIQGTVDSDVAWQLWIAHQLNHGARLYRDIIEVNPPLWFWMALPVDRAASLTGLRPETVLIAALAAAQALSLAATSRLLQLAPLRKALLLIYAAVAFAAFAWIHAGQREQIVLIATLPYAALIAARRSGRPVGPGLALLVGIGAALGFALKQYFLLVPGLLELWLVAGQRRGWSPLRPEIAVMAALGALYAGLILVVSPDYLTVILPMIRLAYGATGAPVFALLLQPALLISLASLIAAIAGLRDRPGQSDGGSGLAEALLVAACGFAMVYFVQGKGWPYHAIPLLGCASITLAAALARMKAVPRPLLLAAPVLLALPLLLSWSETRDPLLPGKDLSAALAGIAPGTSVGFLATEPAFAWSVTLQHRLLYPSRYIGYWMMRAVVDNERRSRPDPRLTTFGRKVVADTVADFRCAPPRRIIVNRPMPAEIAAGQFDILAWLLRDPGFAELMSHYREVSRTSADVFDIATPYPRSPAIACRRSV